MGYHYNLAQLILLQVVDGDSVLFIHKKLRFKKVSPNIMKQPWNLKLKFPRNLFREKEILDLQSLALIRLNYFMWSNEWVLQKKEPRDGSHVLRFGIFFLRLFELKVKVKKKKRHSQLVKILGPRFVNCHSHESSLYYTWCTLVLLDDLVDTVSQSQFSALFAVLAL